MLRWCRRSTVATAGHLIEQRLGALAANDRVGHGIGVLLVSVTGGADAALELNAAALLDNVRRLVRDRVQVGAAAKDHVVPGGVCLGTHTARGRGGLGLACA
jgi:hypothetical protein